MCMPSGNYISKDDDDNKVMANKFLTQMTDNASHTASKTEKCTSLVLRGDKNIVKINSS